MNKEELQKIIEARLEDYVKVSDIATTSVEFYVEVEFWSDLGEDIVETIWFSELTEESFIEGLEKCANFFDVDEHAELWVHSRGKNGCSDCSIIELVEDAQMVKKKLERLVRVMRGEDEEESEVIHINTSNITEASFKKENIWQEK